MPKMENFNMHSAACGEDKPKPEKNRNAPARSKCVGQIPWPRTRRRMPADDDDGQEMATRSLSDQAKRHHHCSRNRHFQVLNSFESCNCSVAISGGAWSGGVLYRGSNAIIPSSFFFLGIMDYLKENEGSRETECELEIVERVFLAKRKAKVRGKTISKLMVRDRTRLAKESKCLKFNGKDGK